jgi:hypothetical protein
MALGIKAAINPSSTELPDHPLHEPGDPLGLRSQDLEIYAVVSAVYGPGRERR